MEESFCVVNCEWSETSLQLSSIFPDFSLTLTFHCCVLSPGQIDPTIKLNERNSILIETFSLTVMKTFALFFLLFASFLHLKQQHNTAQHSFQLVLRRLDGWTGAVSFVEANYKFHNTQQVELGTRSEENYWNETFSSSPLLSLCVILADWKASRRLLLQGSAGGSGFIQNKFRLSEFDEGGRQCNQSLSCCEAHKMIFRFSFCNFFFLSLAFSCSATGKHTTENNFLYFSPRLNPTCVTQRWRWF